jgi:DNA-binding NarL/FixJ family response regulator
MRSVLVCVRTALAAHAVANAATQLGLTDVVSVAVSGPAALAKVAESPADLLLVDVASVRPDTVGFTRLVRERSPEAVIVFFGPEDHNAAQAAVAAGARGVIRGGDHEDLVTSVAKALMLLLRPVRAAVPLQRSEPEPGEDAETGQPGEAGSAGDATVAAPASGGSGAEKQAGTATAAALADAAGSGEKSALAGSTVLGLGAARRPALTERELQVLRGMADGKSNAEIGRELFVSEDTVKTHARRLFRKLGARDRAHAVAAAFRAGLVR